MMETDNSIIEISDNVYSTENLNLLASVSRSESMEKEEDITYEIFEEDSNKGSFKLFDSLGYSYEIEREGTSCTSWQCVNRNKRLKCPASVKQWGNLFTRNCHKHVDAPTSNVFLMSKINLTIRKMATEDLISPASHIVCEVLRSFNLDVSFLSKTKHTFLIRLANRVRQGLRPEIKQRPKIVVLKKELNDTPIKFIEIDLYNDEETVSSSCSSCPPQTHEVKSLCETPESYEIVRDPHAKESLKLFDSCGFSYYTSRRKKKKGKEEERVPTTWLCTVRNKHQICPATIRQEDDSFVPGSDPHSHTPRPTALALAKMDVEMRRAALEHRSKASSLVVDDVLLRHAGDELPKRSRSYWVKLMDNFRERIDKEESRRATDSGVSSPHLSSAGGEEEEEEQDEEEDEEEEGMSYEVVEEMSARKGKKLFDSHGYSYTVRRKTDTTTVWCCRVTRLRTQCPVTVRQVGTRFGRIGLPHAHPPQKDALLRAKFTIDLRRKALQRRERTTTQIVNEVLHDYKCKGVLMPSLSKFSSLVQYVKKCKRTIRNEEERRNGNQELRNGNEEELKKVQKEKERRNANQEEIKIESEEELRSGNEEELINGQDYSTKDENRYEIEDVQMKIEVETDDTGDTWPENPPQSPLTSTSNERTEIKDTENVPKVPPSQSKGVIPDKKPQQRHATRVRSRIIQLNSCPEVFAKLKIEQSTFAKRCPDEGGVINNNNKCATYDATPKTQYPEATFPCKQDTQLVVPEKQSPEVQISQKTIHEFVISQNQFSEIIIPQDQIVETVIPQSEYQETIIPQNETFDTVSPNIPREQRPDTGIPCSKASDSVPAGLKQANPADSNAPKYKCQKCPFESKRKSAMKLHELTEHRNLYKLRCKRCGHHNKRKFKVKVERLKTPKEWGLKCSKCNFYTVQHKQFKQHQLLHFKSKKLKCSKCLIVFDAGNCE